MSRTFRDPIHNEIFLDGEDPVEKLIIKLIDCKEVQRLRWVRQLGTGWFTFHGAEASRFPHSLGAMHVARLMINNCLKGFSIDAQTKNEYKALVMCAALLHDIGHGPFSHSCEKINNIRHESWTCKLIASPNTQIHQCLENFQQGFSDKVNAILTRSYPIKFLSSIVNSQIDCDRFDYLIRDSFHTGTAYGNFDLNRVISNIAANPIHDCLIVQGEKGMLAVEDYLYARYSMYLQVYQHKKCLASDSLLLKLFKRVKLLIKNRRIAFIEKPLEDWICRPEALSLDDFLTVDDTSFIHHIKHWTKEKDIIVKDLARRFLDRDLFKAVKIEKDQDPQKLKEAKTKELLAHNLDPDYYLDLVSIASKPYSFYNPDTSDYSKAIFVENKNRELEEISSRSHVVSSLVKNDFATNWLIFPDLALPKTSQVALFAGSSTQA